MKSNVDRTGNYFERFFSQEDINLQIVRPSRYIRKNCFTFKRTN